MLDHSDPIHSAKVKIHWQCFLCTFRTNAQWFFKRYICYNKHFAWIHVLAVFVDVLSIDFVEPMNHFNPWVQYFFLNTWNCFLLRNINFAFYITCFFLDYFLRLKLYLLKMFFCGLKMEKAILGTMRLKKARCLGFGQNRPLRAWWPEAIVSKINNSNSVCSGQKRVFSAVVKTITGRPAQFQFGQKCFQPQKLEHIFG